MPQTDVLFWERVTRLEPASVPTKAHGFCGAPNLRFQVKVEVASSRDKKNGDIPEQVHLHGAPQGGAAQVRRTSVFAWGENLGAAGIDFRRALK